MHKEIICGIYCIENIINNKKYIGQSINIADRWNKHKNGLNNNIHDNDYLQKSWNKYGEENFKFYILEECLKEDLDEKEIYYIDLYDTLNKDFGYNLKAGGQCGAVSEYGNQKRINSLKEYYKNNEKAKEQKRISALKQWSNPDIKSKICGENNGMYGKKHSDDTKRKISELNSGRISKYRNITPVLCIELNKIYECAAVAQKELNIQSILEVCKGNRKTAGGYHWQFVMENNI